MEIGTYEWEKYTHDNPGVALKAISHKFTSLKKPEIYNYFDNIFEDIDDMLSVKDIETTKRKIKDEIRKKIDLCHDHSLFNYLILTFIWQRTSNQWELTLRHESVHVFIETIDEYYREYIVKKERGEEKYIIWLFLEAFRALALGMRIENALNANCPTGVTKHATLALAKDIPLPPSSPTFHGFDGHEKAISDWLTKLLAARQQFNSAVAAIGKTFIDWLKNEPHWRRDASKLHTDSKRIQADLASVDFFFATELNAYRSSLREIPTFGPARQFSVEHFNVIYCFPFTVKNFDLRDFFDEKNEQEYEKFNKIFEFWEKEVEEKHIGICPKSHKHIELTDVWATPAEVKIATAKKIKDSAEEEARIAAEKVYKIRAFLLPEIRIAEVDNPEQNITLQCELRITSFGNHYLRVCAGHEDYHGYGVADNNPASVLTDCNGKDGEQSIAEGKAVENGIMLHDVYRTLRRSSSFCGTEPLFLDDKPIEGASLQDVASKILAAFDQVLRSYVAQHRPERGVESGIDYDLAKTTNVIFSMFDFTGDGRYSDAEMKRRDGALAKIFMNPIGGPADRLEPWLTRSVPENLKNLAGSELGGRSRIFKTANTTFICLPSHANFVYLDYIQMAEFASTLEPLYINWNAQLSRSMETARRSFNDKDIDKTEEKLINLQNIIVDIEKQTADIFSQRVVTNSVYRKYLDDFIDASAVTHLDAEFDRLSKLSQEIQKAVTEYNRNRENRLTARYQFFVQGTITIAGVFFAAKQVGLSDEVALSISAVAFLGLSFLYMRTLLRRFMNLRQKIRGYL